MARAKRTDRTAARRRHRAEQTEATPDGAAVAAAAPVPGGKPGRTAQAAVAPQRPSISAAFRGAFRPVNLVGDLKALPRLLLHWSFYGPVLATIATTIVYIYASQGRTADSPSDTMWFVVNLAFQMFVFPLPAPAGSSFIAGFGAPRAAWLLGLIVGVVSAICFAVILSSVSASLTTAEPGVDLQSYALQGFLVAPLGSALFAAAAAWYKRFLNLANPNRTQRRVEQQRSTGRGDIKRDRLSR
ncbi:MAG TPA: hypothetical protein VFY23_05320 [Candidatus Limnocylindrales bacterium]|nr:hypothetical protein [Candidatus Limnocylindrales bacterium]